MLGLLGDRVEGPQHIVGAGDNQLLAVGAVGQRASPGGECELELYVAVVDVPQQQGLVFGHPGHLLVVGPEGDALHRFATGTYVLWYPELARRDSVELPERLMKLGAENWLHVTLSTQPPAADGLGMTGSGLFIINPPWTLPQTLEATLPWLSQQLATDGYSDYTLDWETP